MNKPFRINPAKTALLFILLIFVLLVVLFKNQPVETALTQSAAWLYFACTLSLIFLLNHFQKNQPFRVLHQNLILLNNHHFFHLHKMLPK